MGGELGGTQALFVWAHREAAWILDHLGEDGADALARKADRAAESMNTRLWNPHAGAYADCRLGDAFSHRTSVQVNVLATLAGVADAARGEALYRRSLASEDFLGLDTPYFTCYVLEAMSKLGHDERALRLVRDYFGSMVRKGATSFWEVHKPRRDDDIVRGVACRSKSHAWGAGVTGWLTARVLGVRPIEPGYRTALVTPNRMGLDFVRGAVPTPAGTIAVDWPTGQSEMTVVLPQGVTAYAGPASRAIDLGSLRKLTGPGRFVVPMPSSEP